MPPSYMSLIRKPMRMVRSWFIRMGIVAPPEDIDVKIADEQRQARRKLLFLKYRIPGGGKGS